eukprot:755498-Hanusia_phi.AAC.2
MFIIKNGGVERPMGIRWVGVPKQYQDHLKRSRMKGWGGGSVTGGGGRGGSGRSEPLIDVGSW